MLYEQKELENLGHKVWIDVESIYGSSLESMANAIENSSCILMCITSKYKESNFCRLEAEYLIQQKKLFIPLIMEKGYKPDGWLGIILGIFLKKNLIKIIFIHDSVQPYNNFFSFLGSKIYIDFTKNEFDFAFNEVNRNLSLILKHDIQKINRSVNNSSVLKTGSRLNTAETSRMDMNYLIGNISSKKTPEELVEVTWTEDQVEEWFDKMNIDSKIVENLTPCNGQGRLLNNLFHLYNIDIDTFNKYIIF